MSGKQRLKANWWRWALAVLVVAAVAPYAYGLITKAIASPCEDIFRQTRLILDSKLEPIKAKGTVLMEEAIISNLTERSEMMAMGLKTCCVALHGNKISSAEFLGCKETMRAYEARIEKVSQVLDEAQLAKRDENSELVAAKLEEAEKLVNSARLNSEALLTQIRDASVQLAEGTGSQTLPTEFDGVVAEVTRFADTGGMLTLEVTFRNVTQTAINVCVDPRNSYLIDEDTGTRWDDSFRKDYISCDNQLSLKPNKTYWFWMKFKVDPPFPERFTAIVDKVARPIEGLTLE
jgi:hypothetical protein